MNDNDETTKGEIRKVDENKNHPMMTVLASTGTAMETEMATTVTGVPMEDVSRDERSEDDSKTEIHENRGGNKDESSTLSSSGGGGGAASINPLEFHDKNVHDDDDDDDDDEGARIAHGSNELPEKVSPTSAQSCVYPEGKASRHRNHQQEEVRIAQMEKKLIAHDATDEINKIDEEAQVTHHSDDSVRPRKSRLPVLCDTRKKRILAVVALACAAVVAIVVGVSVATVATKNTKMSDNSSPVMSFLIREGISSEADVTRAGSPQNRAALWIATLDAAKLEIPSSSSDDADSFFQFIQRYALATFYYALGGESWDFSMNFLSWNDTCDWFQELATDNGGQVDKFGALCNNVKRVHKILIPWNNMAGQVPPEIGLLTDMRFLAIPSNRNVRGTLPSEMKKLTNLEFLMLSQNNFNGTLPDWIGDLTKLSSLSLGSNDFQGSIPSTIGNLTELTFLSMERNVLSGQMDALEPLFNLQFLYLEKNQFEQTLGSDTFRNLTKLQQLDLSDNFLDGGVPRHLLHMSALHVLDLSNNVLSGTLPTNIARNSALEFLFLYGNQLTGEIPTSVQNLTALNHLDLSNNNNFTGPLPFFLGGLSDLTYLFLANNEFDKGPIPGFLPQLGALRDLSLKGTHRTGTIPSFIGEMTNAMLLDLDRNELTGPLPTELGLLTSLGLLLLNRNQLTGTIPLEVSNMSNLGK
jgi:Leucine-rich repeat (LRR) protein